MRVLVFALLVLFNAGSGFAQKSTTQNPFLETTSNPFPFDKVTPEMIEEAVSLVMENSDSTIKQVSSIEAGKHTVENTLVALDRLTFDISNLIMKLTLIQSTSTIPEVRNSASEEGNRLRIYVTTISLNEPFYKALVRFRNESGKNLNASQQKLLTENIEGFERQGMKLPEEKRKALEAVNAKVIQLGTVFQRNIADARDSIYFAGGELEGIPQRDKDAWKQPDGRYLVYVNTPNYVTVVENADSPETRRKFYLAYSNRAYPVNIEVLDSLLYYRDMLAKKLGFRSYAEYALDDKMASKPENAWKFQDDIQKKLEPHVTREMNVMRELKKQLYPQHADTIYAWDVNYYTRKLKDTRYNLNTDEVKQYFEINNTLEGMFKVYEQLLDISIKKSTGVPVWDEKVLTYDLYSEGKKAGTFYLDLYPRQNKYTHFACFGISLYRKERNVEHLPVAALVCNFPEGSKTQPSLLPHRDVITMFHEFGHLVHTLLARPALSSQGPFSVKRDFIEAPSQFLENWCWEYESLKMLARHHQTGEVLPKPLFDKMKKAQNVNIANFYMRQLFLGYVDLEFEDRYDQVKQEGIVAASKRWWKIQQMPYAEGSHFIAAFGHLNSYAAGYYGYLWSRVYAQDMFSVFEKKGVMDRATGIRYKKTVLEKGSSVEEIDLVRMFLGREPNSKAFLRSLGL